MRTGLMSVYGCKPGSEVYIMMGATPSPSQVASFARKGILLVSVLIVCIRHMLGSCKNRSLLVTPHILGGGANQLASSTGQGWG